MSHKNTIVIDYCALCAGHYGDSGICDLGRPMASPHRPKVEPRELRDDLGLAGTTFRRMSEPRHPAGFRPLQPGQRGRS